MATNIPRNNLTEIVTACLALLDDAAISLAGLMQIVPVLIFRPGDHQWRAGDRHGLQERPRPAFYSRACQYRGDRRQEWTPGDRRHRAALPGQQGAA